jgi:hypothetical protein
VCPATRITSPALPLKTYDCAQYARGKETEKEIRLQIQCRNRLPAHSEHKTAMQRPEDSDNPSPGVVADDSIIAMHSCITRRLRTTAMGPRALLGEKPRDGQ